MLGEDMRIQATIGLLAVTVCVVIAAAFPNTVGSQSNPAAQTNNNNAQTTGNKTAAGHATSKFRDVLELPSKMSSLAEKSMLNGIASAGQRVVVVGRRGHILYSNDKGKTWTQCHVPVSVDLTAVYFPTPKQGWAVGHDGVVLHSADGGLSWSKQLDGKGICRIMGEHYREHPLPAGAGTERLVNDIKLIVDAGPVNPILDVWFEDESNGFIVGAFNLIFHTTDGGKSWTPWFERTDNPTGMHLYAVRGIGKDIFISGEQGLVLKLDRQAGRFKSLKTPYIGTYFGIMGKPGAVVAFGMRGNVFRSGNGGTHWEQVKIEQKEGVLGGTLMNGDFILVTQGGNVLLSKDDAKSFKLIKQASGTGIPIHAVTAVDARTVVIAGWLGVKTQPIQ